MSSATGLGVIQLNAVLAVTTATGHLNFFMIDEFQLQDWVLDSTQSN